MSLYYFDASALVKHYVLEPRQHLGQSTDRSS